MSITANPFKTTPPPTTRERQTERFIEGAGKTAAATKQKARTTTMKLSPVLLERADRAAARLGISRTAFFSTAAAEKLEQMGF